MNNLRSRTWADFATRWGRDGFAALLTAVFLIVLGMAASRHEFWRDEMQAWLIARDSPNWRALLEQAHYEGAPPLWSLLLRPLALLTPRPEAMQWLTTVLAGATIFLLVRFAPFSRLQKILLVCSSYLLFEYGLVCRNYLPGILALTLACIFRGSAKERPWPFALALVVASWASAHNLIVGVAVGVSFWGAEALKRFRDSAVESSQEPRFRFGPLAVYLAGLGGAVYSMMPRPDTMYSPAHGWILQWIPERFAKMSWAFVNAYFPMPRPPGFFWIPPWDMPEPSFTPALAFTLGALLLVSCLLFFRRHPAALLAYLCGTLGIAAFLYTKYLGFSRHTGFFFLTFFYALWIMKSESTPAKLAPERSRRFLLEAAFTVMLGAQAVTGIWAVREDFRRPFSCGKGAAARLEELNLDKVFIAVGPDWAGSPLAGYLNRTVYYPQRLEYGSFTKWDRKREEGLSDAEFFRRAAAEAKGREMVIAMEHPLDPEFMSTRGIKFLGHIGGSLTPFEDYFLHHVPATDESPSSSTGATQVE